MVLMKKLKSRAGFTLVEMLVTFTLLGIFMVATTRIISYTVNIYYAAKGIDYSLSIADMLSEKVSGMVSQMQEVPMNLSDLTGDEGGAISQKLPCSVDDKFYFIDETNCPVEIETDDNGYLRINYYKKKKEPYVGYDIVPWYFDEKTYMGYNIKDFSLDKAGVDYPKNVYRLSFTIHSPKYGDYKTVRYIKCYNMQE